MARTDEVGDETGSAITVARLARDVMRQAMLLARHYAPYPKWLGTAFARLDHGDDLPRSLADAVHAGDAGIAEDSLAEAYRALARRHNATGLTESLSDTVGDFHGRPARVLMADRFARACLDTVSNPWLRALPLIGSIDQIVDSTDVLTSPAHCRRLATLYPP